MEARCEVRHCAPHLTLCVCSSFRSMLSAGALLGLHSLAQTLPGVRELGADMTLGNIPQVRLSLSSLSELLIKELKAGFPGVVGALQPVPQGQSFCLSLDQPGAFSSSKLLVDCSLTTSLLRAACPWVLLVPVLQWWKPMQRVFWLALGPRRSCVAGLAGLPTTLRLWDSPSYAWPCECRDCLCLFIGPTI